MAHAAVLHLRRLLQEELLPFLAGLLVVPTLWVGDFLDATSNIVNKIVRFRSIGDFPSYFLAPIKRHLQKTVQVLPHRGSDVLRHLDISRAGLEEAMRRVNNLNFGFENYMRELDGGVMSRQVEFVNGVFSTVQEIKECISLYVTAAATAASLYHRVNGDLLSGIHSPTTFLLKKDHEEVNSIYDLLKYIDQMLVKNIEKIRSTYELLQGIDQLLLTLSLEEASSSSSAERERPVNDVKQPGDVDQFLSTLQRGKDNDLETGSSRRSSVPQGEIVVGLDDYIQRITDIVTRSVQSELTVMTITGMGGIGKTTLARIVYKQCSRFSQFDRLTWVNCTLSIDQILSHLLHSAGVPDDKSHAQTIQDKGESLWKSMRGKKFLIVFDGLWDFQAWEDVWRFLPDDKTGSRILITSRHEMQSPTSIGTNIPTDLSRHCFPMTTLNNDQSWELLEKKLFGEKGCPSNLVEIGKQIAARCEGLPLAIVLIAGTLLHIPEPESYESWLSAVHHMASESCVDAIALSYKNICQIPLKPVFCLWEELSLQDVRLRSKS